MRKRLDDLEESQEYMDSGDYQVSESGFSQSFRSRAPSHANKSGQKPKEKKEFYFYDQHKFSSYAGGGSAGGPGSAAGGGKPSDLDDEF
jgi:hypothetical protein